MARVLPAQEAAPAETLAAATQTRRGVDVPLADVRTPRPGSPVRLRQVIADADTWGEAWRAMRGPADTTSAPPVDFTREVIFLAADGVRPTTGYAVRVMGAWVGGDSLEVAVFSLDPGGCVVGMMITRPTHAVRFARGALRPIRLVERRVPTCERQ